MRVKYDQVRPQPHMSTRGSIKTRPDESHMCDPPSPNFDRPLKSAQADGLGLLWCNAILLVLSNLYIHESLASSTVLVLCLNLYKYM